MFSPGAPLPTCRGWMSVRPPILTARERTRGGASCQDLPALTGRRRGDNCERVSHKWGGRRGRRGFVLLPELLQKCQKRRRISLFGSRVGHFLTLSMCVCVCVYLSRKRPDKGRKGVQWGCSVCECVTVISRQTRGSCLWIATLPFLQNVQPSSAHFPGLSQRRPLPSQGASAVKLQSELQLPLAYTDGVICTEHTEAPRRCQDAADLRRLVLGGFREAAEVKEVRTPLIKPLKTNLPIKSTCDFANLRARI